MSSKIVSDPEFECILRLERIMEKRTPTEDIYREIGKKIADLRKQLNITQQELADKIESTRQTITLYETGARRIPLVSLIDIARELHTELYELIPDHEKKRPGPTPRVKLSFEKITQISESDQKIVLDLLDSIYEKGKH